MHRRILIVLAIVAAATAAIVFTSPRAAVPVGTRQPSAPAGKPSVAVTTSALADIVRSVAGTAVNVTVIMPPGGNAHTFEPTPTVLASVSAASAVYAIGHGFDDWIDGLLADNAAPKVVVDRGIALRESAEITHDEAAEGEHEEPGHEEDGHEEDEHGHGATDPHYWLVASNAATIAQTVADDLTARFPEHAASFAANLAAKQASLLDADAEIRAMLSAVPNRNIVTLHDAWYYFAEAYGLHVVGSFEPSAAREPSPQYLIALENAVRQAGITVIYTELGLPLASLATFADDNGLTVVALDPLEGYAEGTYEAILIRNARAIQEHQR